MTNCPSQRHQCKIHLATACCSCKTPPRPLRCCQPCRQICTFQQCRLQPQAALADTEVPAVSVVEASEADGEPELDVDDEDSMTLDVAGVPVIVTVGQVSCEPQHGMTVHFRRQSDDEGRLFVVRN
jgi:hypothetical protein